MCLFIPAYSLTGQSDERAREIKRLCPSSYLPYLTVSYRTLPYLPYLSQLTVAYRIYRIYHTLPYLPYLTVPTVPYRTYRTYRTIPAPTNPLQVRGYLHLCVLHSCPPLPTRPVSIDFSFLLPPLIPQEYIAFRTTFAVLEKEGIVLRGIPQVRPTSLHTYHFILTHCTDSLHST